MFSSQMMREAISNVWTVLQPVRTFVRRHAVWTAIIAIGSIALALLVTNAWSTYDSWRVREVQFLSGPGGGSTTDVAQRISDHAARRSSGVLGTKYHIRVQATDGYEENRRRIGQDQEGLTIGFAHDGFGDASNIAILVPLEWNYLQILCTRGFRDSVLNNREVGEKLTFAQLAGKLRAGRVFLGLAESGTRQLAELVLASYGLRAHEFAATGILDWHDMRSALYSGALDVAFYSGPTNARILKSIADDGKCILVGLDGTRDAIVQQNYQLMGADLQPNLYTAKRFCPEQLQTIASRRVLVCSRAMPDSDAYFLASAAREAIQDRVDIRWNNTPADPAKPEFKPLAYVVHPGAERVRDQQSPPSWLMNWPTFITALAIFILGEAARISSVRRSHTSTEMPRSPSKATPLPVTYPALNQELARWVTVLGHASLSWDDNEHKQWLEFVGRLQEHITALKARGVLTADQAEALSSGVSELRIEISLHSPNQVRRARREADKLEKTARASPK